uniref:ATP-dependent Clp protease proteolytic subunit 1 n=1 Tax=Silene olgiana TaxID=2764680 RepID=UPI0027A93262|nr:ATP-dependent Clp protease proteolytic subunit 1 [Silene olgiana]WFF47101.1 ATP-dependent Clp protease proteolytic subunit 1 [Silene olgiana]
MAFPHARIMIHQPSTLFSSYKAEAPSAFFAETKYIMDIREKVTKIYERRTGKPLSVIYQDMERKYYMSAKEAKNYGIIDVVGADLKK